MSQSADSEGISRPRPGRWKWLPPAIAVIVAATYVAGEGGVTHDRQLGVPLDDSWIHLQFAARMAAGDGSSFNPGVWVTGSTAPLWTALLAFLTLLPGPVVIAAKIVGIAFHALTAVGAVRLSQGLGIRTRLALTAGVLTASSGWLVWSAPSVMEVPLAAALSVWGLALHVEERQDLDRRPRSLVLFALAVLARPECALLLVLALVDRAIAWRPGDQGTVRPTLRIRSSWLEGVALAIIVLLPTLIFYRAIGGSWMPSTFAVKASSWVQMPSPRYLRVVADILFRGAPLLLLAAFPGALVLASRLGGRRDRGLLPALWLFGLPLAYACLSPPQGPFAVGNFGRYYFPLLPILIVVGLLGIERTLDRLPNLAIGRTRLPLASLVIVGLIALAVLDAAAGRERYLGSVRDVDSSDVRAARWLAAHVPPDALIAAQDIGAVKYLLPNPVLDLAGLVNPDILPVLRGEIPGDADTWEARLFAYLSRERPDVLVVFPKSYPRLTSGAGFTRLATFDIPGNRTMAGPRLAIIRPPWSRLPPTTSTE